VIHVKLKKKRTLPVLLEQMKQYSDLSYSWLDDYKIIFAADSTT
jgi:hypothetical protein